MIDFFICSIKSPQCTDKYSKKNFDSYLPSLCFDVPKTWNFTSGRGVGGYKTVGPKQETGNECDIISGLQASRKFHVFVISKHGERKLLLKMFLCYTYQSFTRANKKISHIHFKGCYSTPRQETFLALICSQQQLLNFNIPWLVYSKVL